MSVKKKASARKAVKAKAESPGNAQSAAERKLAENEVSRLIAKFTPTQLALVRTVRRSLRKRLPTAYEVAYEYRDCFVISYSPSEHGYEGVLAIRGSEKCVRLYFNQGKDLPDPEKLLQGTSRTRYLDIASGSTLARPAVANLIEKAIAHNRVPFERAGKGSVLIRSTAAKKRRPS